MTWYDPAFSYKKTLVIPHANVQGESDLLDFPLLVGVTDPDLISMTNGGRMASPVGNDLLFTDATETRQLPYEIASFNGATGNLLAWVRVPVLSASQDTLLYLYFGNSTVTTSRAQPSLVWDSTYKGVWHMEDNANVAAVTPFSLYGRTSASSTLSTAATLASSTGGIATTVNTTVPAGSGYYELFGLGGTSSAQGSLPSPSAKGWLYDVTSLEGKNILSGTWLLTGTIAVGSGTIPNCTLTLRAYKRSSGGTYTAICSVTSSPFTLTSTGNTLSMTVSSVSQISFGSGDKLYVDAFLNASPGSQRSIHVSVSSTSSGLSNDLEIDTPGYQNPSDPALTNVLDSTANANTGTAAASTSTLSTTGQIGNALTFNGSSDVITLAQTPLTGTGSFSVFAWINTSTTSTRQAIVTWGGAGTNTQELLSVNTAGAIQNDLSGSTGPQSSVTVTDGGWHHVGVVNTAGSFQLYVDGVADGSPVTLSPNLTSGSPQIGNDGSAHWFNGTIDEVRIESTARTANWIAMLYANQVSPSSFVQVGQTIPSMKNIELTVLSANFATGTMTSADQLNVSARGVDLFLVAVPQSDQTLTVTVQGKDVASGAYYTLASFPNLAFGFYTLTIYPGLSSSGTSLDTVLPRVWRAIVTPTTSETYTCLLGASLLS
jgi:hypothetical protein